MLACSLVTRTCLKTTRGLISGTLRRLTLEVLSPEKNNCSLIWKLFKFLMTLLAGLFEMRGCWHIGLRWAIVALWATCLNCSHWEIFKYRRPNCLNKIPCLLGLLVTGIPEGGLLELQSVFSFVYWWHWENWNKILRALLRSLFCFVFILFSW